MNTPLPPAYIGVWRRTRIARRNGATDTTTAVWWFQSPRFHIDLRIPANRPQIASAAALAQLPAAAFATFAAQSGFAGTTLVEDDCCEWRPEIAFPALSTDVDAGVMHFTGMDHVHERGLDDSYEEDWERIARAPCTGVRLKAVGTADRVAYLVLGANWMALAHGSKGAAFPARDASGQAAWSEFCVASRERDGDWRIVASNNPWREGARLHIPARLRDGQIMRLDGCGDFDWRVSDLAPSSISI